MNKSVYFVLAVVSALLNHSAWAGRESGGGIIIAAEFATTGRQAIEILVDGDPAMNLSSILSHIKETKIIPVEDLCKKDPVYGKAYCEDAHYDATTNVVLLAYKNWDSFSCNEKLILSTHELLRAAGLEGEDYKYSGRFISNTVSQCYGKSDAEQIHCADETITIESKISDLCRTLAFEQKKQINEL